MYQAHVLGIGVMEMEGFGHKNTVHSITNGKGNVALQSLKVMHLFFQNGYHNVIREVKQQVKTGKYISNVTKSCDVNVQELIDTYLLEIV